MSLDYQYIGPETPLTDRIICWECEHTAGKHCIGVERRCSVNGCGCRIPMVNGNPLSFFTKVATLAEKHGMTAGIIIEAADSDGKGE